MASPPLWRKPGVRVDSPAFLALPCFSLGNMLKLVLVYKSTIALPRHGDERNRASVYQYVHDFGMKIRLWEHGQRDERPIYLLLNAPGNVVPAHPLSNPDSDN